MRKSRPVIGISSSVTIHNGLPSVHLHQKYVSAVIDAGGLPIIIPIGDKEMEEEWASLCDGILLSGGEDVDPQSYDHEPDPELGKVNENRDKTEMGLIEYACKEKKPILAICRGIAVLNAALGGDIIQDIEKNDEDAIKHYQEAARPQATHEIEVEEGSRLYKIMENNSKVRVNSMHHQAIGEVASNLKVVARASDGVIEGVEGKEQDPLLLGAQWHPEEMASENQLMANLFEELVKECRKKDKVEA